MDFELGQLVATPSALEVLSEHNVMPIDLIGRHIRGDWGDLDADDADLNEQALKDGSRIFSSYLLDENTKIWVITEAKDDNGKRSATTILLPEDY